MIIKRRQKEFSLFDDAKSSLNNVKSGKGSSSAAADDCSSGFKLPPTPDIAKPGQNANIVNMTELNKENRLATMAANRMMKSFSYQPTVGNTYVGNVQVVDDKVLSPIEGLSNRIAEDEYLGKPTHRFRTALKGYIDGVRLLKHKHDSKKKTSGQRIGPGKGKKRGSSSKET